MHFRPRQEGGGEGHAAVAAAVVGARHAGWHHRKASKLLATDYPRGVKITRLYVYRGSGGIILTLLFLAVQYTVHLNITVFDAAAVSVCLFVCMYCIYNK